MAMSKEEKDRLTAELAKKANRDKETDEQKWLRGAISDQIREVLEDMFPADEEGEEEGKKKSSGPGSILEGIFGKTG